MEKPLISVVMPVYNAELYLHEAITSILNQSYLNFEFLIINDGSIDGSENVIKSYEDPRIVYIKNTENRGLVYSLNKGIKCSKGKFIARMDADDISDKERLKIQLHFYLENKCDLLFSTIQLINESSEMIPPWKADRENISHFDIVKYLPNNNCLAHPTLFITKDLLNSYKYDYKQYKSEDYDLWLRMATDNRIFKKISKPLVYHRILKNSFTRQQKEIIYLKLFNVKYKFLVNNFKINTFCLRVIIYMIRDMIFFVAKKLIHIINK